MNIQAWRYRNIYSERRQTKADHETGEGWSSHKISACGILVRFDDVLSKLSDCAIMGDHSNQELSGIKTKIFQYFYKACLVLIWSSILYAPVVYTTPFQQRTDYSSDRIVPFSCSAQSTACRS